MAVASPLKVLLVPEAFHWILGTWAKQIALHGRRHHYYFFSTQLLSSKRKEFDTLVEMVDVVHVLTQHGMVDLPLPEAKARVGTIHHVVDWAELEPIAHADAICVGADEWQCYLQEKGVATEKLFDWRHLIGEVHRWVIFLCLLPRTIEALFIDRTDNFKKR